MNDDEQPVDGPGPADLGRFLRDEVPGPGPGYWDAIDARLASVEAEASSSYPSPGAGGADDGGEARPGEEVSEELDDSWDTDTNVIRLTDMTTRPSKRFSSPPVLLAAAAAVVVLLSVGFALNRDRDPVETQIATEGDTDTDTDTDTEVTDSDADTELSADGDEPVASTPPAIRYCYAGGELAEGVVAYADLSAPIGENPTVRIASRTDINGRSIYEIVDGTVGLDGAVTGEFANLTDGTRFPATFVFIDPEGLALSDDVPVEPADCGDIADDIADIEAAVAALEPTVPASDIEFLPEEAAAVWVVTADGPVFGRAGPGLAQEIARTYEPGFAAPLSDSVVGTGRSAIADDLTWIEVRGQGEASNATWWVQSAVLTPAETDDDLGDGATALANAEPAIWPVPAETTARVAPGLDADEAGVLGPDAYVTGTGRSAIADESVWVEVAATDERSAVWVELERIVRPNPNRRCYTDEFAGTVIVMDWSDDLETFRGFLRVAADDTYLTIAGRRSADIVDIYNVNLATEGETEFVTEPWEVFDGGVASGDTPSSEVACAQVTTGAQATAEARFDAADFPPIPDAG